MSDLVERKAVLDALANVNVTVCGSKSGTTELVKMVFKIIWPKIQKAVQDVPTERAEPVRYAHWVPLPDHNRKTQEKYYTCSRCGRAIVLFPGMDPAENGFPYCHCGAKMEEKEE